jgi:hypothetical protein
VAYEPLTQLADVKGWLKSTSTTSDALLSKLIAQLSHQAGIYLSRDNLGSVEQYTEFYRYPRVGSSGEATILLRHYPVTQLISVSGVSADIPILADPSIANQGGVWLEQDGRTLTILNAGAYLGPSQSSLGAGSMTRIAYRAGYASVPPGLSQAINQWVGEVAKSQDWIGYTSKSIGGENVSFEQGRQWNMSKRTKELLEPYRNRVPMMGFA